MKTGEPADGVHRIHNTIGGSSNWLVLLIFLGPVGWLFLLAGLILGGSSRQLLVRLPYSYDALHREHSQFRAAVVAGIVMVGRATAMVIGLTGPTPRSQVRETVIYLLIAATVCAVITTFVLALRYSLCRPGIELDASSRWGHIARRASELRARSRGPSSAYYR